MSSDENTRPAQDGSKPALRLTGSLHMAVKALSYASRQHDGFREAQGGHCCCPAPSGLDAAAAFLLAFSKKEHQDAAQQH